MKTHKGRGESRNVVHLEKKNLKILQGGEHKFEKERDPESRNLGKTQRERKGKKTASDKEKGKEHLSVALSEGGGPVRMYGGEEDAEKIPSAKKKDVGST